MELSKINSNGQVSIPSRIRRQLGLKPGDFVRVELGSKGEIALKPVSLQEKDPWAELRPYEKKGVDLTLLWENLKRTATERLERHQNMLGLVGEAKRSGIK